MANLRMHGLILLSAAVATTAIAQDFPREPHVATSGTAMIQVVPDLLNWRIEVVARGPKVATIAAELSKAAKLTLAFIRTSGVEAQKIQTTDATFDEDQENVNGRLVHNGFNAVTSISFSTTDLRLYDTLWKGLSEIQGVRVRGVSFDVARRADLRADARQQAVVAAREKAKAMAGSIGASIGEALLIAEEEASSASYLNLSSTRDAEYDNLGTSSIAPGRVAVTARVKAVFRLVQPAK